MIVKNAIGWHFAEVPLWSFKRDIRYDRPFIPHIDPIDALIDSTSCDIAVYRAGFDGDRFVIDWGAYADPALLIYASSMMSVLMTEQRNIWRDHKGGAKEEVLAYGVLISGLDARKKSLVTKEKDADDLHKNLAEIEHVRDVWAERCKENFYNTRSTDWQNRKDLGPVCIWRCASIAAKVVDPAAPPMVICSVFALIFDFLRLKNREDYSSGLSETLRRLEAEHEHDENRRRRDARVNRLREGLGPSKPWKGKT